MKIGKILLPLIIVLAVAIFFSVFVVKEVNQAIVLQFSPGFMGRGGRGDHSKPLLGFVSRDDRIKRRYPSDSPNRRRF